MARSPINLVVFGPTGAPVSGASVTIQKRGTSVNSVVYANDANSATAANPIISDSIGRVAGWLETGSYQAIITASGMSTRTEYFDSTPIEAPSPVYVGDPGQVQFANANFVQPPSVQQRLYYYKFDSIVHIEGSVKNNTAGAISGSTIFTLPAGFRPLNGRNMYFPALVGETTQSSVKVYGSGAVELTGSVPASSYASIDISFLSA